MTVDIYKIGASIACDIPVSEVTPAQRHAIKVRMLERAYGNEDGGKKPDPEFEAFLSKAIQEMDRANCSQPEPQGTSEHLGNSLAMIEDMDFKYVIIKHDDIEKYLPSEQRNLLDSFLSIIAMGRISDGKSAANTYVVVNTDEPYIYDIVSTLKANGHWGREVKG